MKQRPGKRTTIRLNTAYAIKAACARCQTIPRDDPDHEWEVVFQPARSAKTLAQLATFHLWADEASRTDVNQWMGHSKEWWIHRWKIEFYLPALETEAAEQGDDALLATFEGWRNLWRDAAPERKEFVYAQLAETSALSFAYISRDHLSRVLDGIVRWCGGEGILLTIPEAH